MVVPWLQGPERVRLASGIVDATILPHAVYLHSGLTQKRIKPQTAEEARRIHRCELIDVVVAMAIAVWSTSPCFAGRIPVPWHRP